MLSVMNEQLTMKSGYTRGGKSFNISMMISYSFKDASLNLHYVFLRGGRFKPY